MSRVHDLDATLGAALPAWLPRQRWFGGKGRAIALVSMVDVAWLAADKEALVVVAVTDQAGATDRYALWLTLDAGEGAKGAIAPLVSGDGTWVADVAPDADATPALWRTLAQAAEVRTVAGGWLRIADITPAAHNAFRSVSTVRPLGTEQSNTSIRIGTDLVFKLFRRLQPGENPELEVCRFLARQTPFTAVPALHGSVTYVPPVGEAATVAVVQGWIPNHGDGWHYVVSRLDAAQAASDAWPSWHDDLFTLGATTAAFHHASASDPSAPDFAPTPATPADVARWTDDVTRRAARLARALGTAALEPALRDPLRTALGRLASGDGAVPPAIDGPDLGFSTIRVHGDYHLGQTLKTADGFVLIDFEGEPTRTVEERRQRHCALKDVAGMLRSFAYASAVATRTPGASGPAPPIDEARMSAAFLDGYRGGTAAPCVFLPDTVAARDAWLRFFVVEKALYELEYEVHNRPDWVHIPAGGLLRMLDV